MSESEPVMRIILPGGIRIEIRDRPEAIERYYPLPVARAETKKSMPDVKAVRQEKIEQERRIRRLIVRLRDSGLKWDQVIEGVFEAEGELLSTDAARHRYYNMRDAARVCKQPTPTEEFPTVRDCRIAEESTEVPPRIDDLSHLLCPQCGQPASGYEAYVVDDVLYCRKECAEAAGAVEPIKPVPVPEAPAVTPEAPVVAPVAGQAIEEAAFQKLEEIISHPDPAEDPKELQLNKKRILALKAEGLNTREIAEILSTETGQNITWQAVMGVIKRSKKAEAATSQEPPKPTGLQLSVPEKVRRGISLSPKEYAEFVQQTRCKAPVDEDEDDGPDNQPDEVVE